MTTAASSLMPGLPYPVAQVLADQIDGTPSAATLCQAGFSYPVAVELARQAVAGTGEISKLVALGLNPTLATAIKAAIDA